ncbi:MAG: Ribose operon repressor [Firmicutes bacterium ADurb.Bin248]|nr:MAG: Ribose operon repressor [Firmicutes bacterium ADurb.Bin248]HOG00382.1 LacI family DNA-binding transcriptional regulator [Clostridia bacterium]HPK15224.1 LacI family DNA-binding transcriptional regulator [Clostridia bacterium]
MKKRLIDIARLAGVSKATASRALADSPLVREETKLRVQEIARSFRYQPNALAQAVATKRSGILGLCIYQKNRPYFAHTFFGPVLDSVLEEAGRNNYHIVLAISSSEEDTFDEHFIKDSIDGAILISFAPQHAVTEFARRGIPLVLVNALIDSPNNAFILDDNYGGARALMEHLIAERGRRRIAIITDRLSHSSYLLRYMAYMDAHREHGIPIYENPAVRADDLWHGYAPPEAEVLALYGLKPPDMLGTPVVLRSTSPEEGRQAMRMLLGSGDAPDAVFATTDSIAVGVLQAIREANLRIPEDIAVAGYDDIEAAKSCVPPLTTVSVNRCEIGRLAVSELLAQIAQPSSPSRMRIVPNRLVVREST